MMSLWRKKKESEIIVEKVVEETNQLLNQFHHHLEDRFRDLNLRLDVIETEIQLLNKKLQTKEIRDRQDYGHLAYKVQELSGRKFNESDS